MGNFIYLFIVVLFVVAWAVAFFGYSISGFIQILIMLALFAVLIRGIRREMFDFRGSKNSPPVLKNNN